VNGVTVVGKKAYVAAGLFVQIIDVSNPASPVRLGGCSTGGTAFGVAVSGNLACVTAYNAGLPELQVIDVSNPATPVRLGSYDTRGMAYGVAVSGTVAYVADYDAGLQVIDVSNPASPVRLGGYDSSGFGWGVAVAGGRIYLADGEKGLKALCTLPNVQSMVRVDGGTLAHRTRSRRPPTRPNQGVGRRCGRPTDGLAIRVRGLRRLHRDLSHKYYRVRQP